MKRKKLTLPVSNNVEPNPQHQPFNSVVWQRLTQEEKRAINRLRDSVKLS